MGRHERSPSTETLCEPAPGWVVHLSLMREEIAMWQRLRRPFGTAAESPSLDGEYDPIYGLPWRAVEEWLARNPGLKEKYEAELEQRLAARRVGDG